MFFEPPQPPPMFPNNQQQKTQYNGPVLPLPGKITTEESIKNILETRNGHFYIFGQEVKGERAGHEQEPYTFYNIETDFGSFQFMVPGAFDTKPRAFIFLRGVMLPDIMEDTRYLLPGASVYHDDEAEKALTSQEEKEKEESKKLDTQKVIAKAQEEMQNRIVGYVNRAKSIAPLEHREQYVMCRVLFDLAITILQDVEKQHYPEPNEDMKKEPLSYFSTEDVRTLANALSASYQKDMESKRRQGWR